MKGKLLEYGVATSLGRIEMSIPRKIQSMPKDIPDSTYEKIFGGEGNIWQDDTLDLALLLKHGDGDLQRFYYQLKHKF